ncbi:MAG: hemerythrin HHE cation-binding protein [Gammaproteobacteria bacterium RBG_16_57_12]|nr:MAG: hemerythrin HHE cation-binding protein [Gammaproteobacteria bacterium RBG_16_57_12]
MTKLINALIAEHRACDDEFALAEKAVADQEWTKAAELCRHFVQSMECHLRHEEEVLFPAFEERTGMTSGPTRVMRMEHEDMRQLFHDMEESIKNKDREGYLGQSETLLILMQQHNMKEENILYPMVQNALRADQDNILAKIKSIAV